MRSVACHTCDPAVVATTATFELHEGARNPTLALYMRITKSGTQEVFGETEAFIGQFGAPVDVPFKLITDLGWLDLHWTMSEAGAPKTCAELGVASIRIDAIPATGPTVTLTGPCSSGNYSTGFLPTGAYRIEMTATSANGPGFGARDGVAVPPGRLRSDISPIDIAF
jgi:hypothetical protein